MIKKGTHIQNQSIVAGIDVGSAKCCCSIGKINFNTGNIMNRFEEFNIQFRYDIYRDKEFKIFDDIRVFLEATK